jgi:YfiH family protein
MFSNNRQEKKFITVPGFEKIPFLVHGFGNRHFQDRDIKENPRWRDFELILLKQIHSDIIHVMTSLPALMPEGDAMLTNRSGLILGIKTADCLPVFLVDLKKKAIAAVHCGWRGTSKQILPKVAEKMKSTYGCDVSSLLVLLGPSIEADCYEVGADVYQDFKKSGLSTKAFTELGRNTGKYHFDVRQANLLQILDLGIIKKNIYSVDLCTFCCSDLHSFRRDKNKAGRLLNFIALTL